MAICTGNSGNFDGLQHASSNGVGVWSSVWHAVLHTGQTCPVVKCRVVSVGGQWQREIQWQHNGVCIRLQVYQLRRQWHLRTKGILYWTTIIVLLYGLEVCPLSKSDLQSLDFVVNRFLMKMSKTSNYDIICKCRNYLCFFLPSEFLAKRHNRFLAKFNSQYSPCDCYVAYDILSVISVTS